MKLHLCRIIMLTYTVSYEDWLFVMCFFNHFPSTSSSCWLPRSKAACIYGRNTAAITRVSASFIIGIYKLSAGLPRDKCELYNIMLESSAFKKKQETKLLSQ